VLISIVIPTFNEKDLYNTLARLTKQTVFEKYKDQVEIIIADFDPENNNNVYHESNRFQKDFPPILLQYIIVERKGIAFARHKGITKSTGHTIVNFDADAYYSHPNCIDLCTRPILNNECVLTCCDNMLNIHELDESNHKHENVLVVRMAYTVASRIQKDGMIVIYEPGMCFSRYAYDFSGGFNDVKQSEGMFLSSRIIYNFGFGAKRHIPDAAVVVSARRAIASSKYGLIDTWFNYDNAFRETEKFTL
jgi:glycosyltransferase involved in cell wall biosynthesis